MPPTFLLFFFLFRALERWRARIHARYTPCIYTDRSRWDATTSFVEDAHRLTGWSVFLEREEGKKRVTINGAKKPNGHLAVIINENGESGVKIRNRDIPGGGDAASRLSLRDYLRVGQVSEAGRGAAAHSLAARDGNSSIPKVCLDTWNGLARRSDTCAECFCSRRIINGQRLRMLSVEC